MTTQCRFANVKLLLNWILPFSLWCWQWVEGDCRRANRGLVCAITQRPSPLHRSSRTVAVIQTLSQASITLAVWSQATEWKKLHWIFQSFKMLIAPYGPIPSKHEKTGLFRGRKLSLCAIHSSTLAQTKDKLFSLIILKHIKWFSVLSPTARNWCKLVASQLLSACRITHACSAATHTQRARRGRLQVLMLYLCICGPSRTSSLGSYGEIGDP